jgi:hypothetical protein
MTNCDKLLQAVLMTRAELMRHALSQALTQSRLAPVLFSDCSKALLFVLIIDVFLVQQRQNGLGI